jgi:hypothetical protein
MLTPNCGISYLKLLLSALPETLPIGFAPPSQITGPFDMSDSELLASLGEINVEPRILQGALEDSADNTSLLSHCLTGSEASVPSRLSSAAAHSKFWAEF